MRFTSRDDVIRFFDAGSTAHVREQIADRLIGIATVLGLRFGDDWQRVWDVLAGSDSYRKHFIRICEAA